MDQPEPERQLGIRLYRLEVLLYHDAARAAQGRHGPGADLVDVPVTGKEPTPCLPSGKRRPVPSARAPLSEP